MKYLLTAFIMFGIIFQVQSQTKSLATTPNELLEKSNNQYTAGWILLGTGTAFMVTSLAIAHDYSTYGEYPNQTLDAVLGWTGVISFIASVPVFLSAGQNARMAARFSLQNQVLHQPISFPGHQRSMPAISLKIPL